VTERPRLNRLVLSPPGKRIVILFIVLGVLVLAGTTTVGIINGARASRTAHKLDDAHADVVIAYQTFVTTTQSCNGQLACLHEADGRLADSLERARQQVDALTFPPQTVSAAQQVRNDLSDQITLARQLQTAEGPAYNRVLPQLQGLVTRFDTDYQTLRQELPA
jgi:hypothetical protein